MFDFLEEDLASQQKSNEVQSSLSGEEKQVLPEPVVYTMPEKFRHTLKKGGKGPIIIAAIVGGLLFLATTGATLYFFVWQPQQKSPPQEQPKKEQEEKKQEEVKKEEEQKKEEEKPKEEAPKPPPPAFTPGADADVDGISDLEERLYKTDAQKTDTDGDGYPDALELENIYDPTKGDSARIESSGLVSRWTNQAYNYSFLYPASFTVSVVNQTDREIMVGIAASGEFFTVKVEENPNAISPIEWYTSREEGVDASTLQVLDYDTWSGVVSRDGLTAYLVPKKSTSSEGEKNIPLIYSIQYDLNKKTEANLLETFKMLLKSFSFLDVSGAPPPQPTALEPVSEELGEKQKSPDVEIKQEPVGQKGGGE